ncbi:MAG: 3-oxoacyl-ACP reductase FabG [Xanthobacteraceae bacterium]
MDGEKELDGRVALVTGAGRNIGRAIALELAAGGAAIVVNARGNMDEAKGVAGEIEAAGGRALAVTGDVADAAAVNAMVDAAVARFSRIDYLVNNAAMRGEKPLQDMTYAEWRSVLDVTLDGAFHCVKACLPHLKQSGAGAIVNMGGLSAHAGSKDRAHVLTAKSGLAGFTRALACDLAGDNVTVNCVAPGLVTTARPKDFVEPQHHAIHHTLSGKRGAPQDIATLVRFLCGPGARYITGQTIHASGGAFLT